jgi:UDP-N-acetylmuramyl pentapeptide phosphotransferase/UDP-N-acetylglucosamine-1-phosphate transferase
MLSLIVAFFTSFLITQLIIRTYPVQESSPNAISTLSIQQFNLTSIPRVGSVGIFVALILGIITHYQSATFGSLPWQLTLLSCIPVAIGLGDDLTGKIGIGARLLGVCIAALLVVFLLGIHISRTGLPGVDALLTHSALSILLTIFAITGLTNAYNIIDGFNGLSSMVGLLALTCISYLAFILGDSELLSLSLILSAAILGFFILNYPRGLIFLGDGGAYLIGFWIAVLSIWLVNNHPEVSPWFVLLVNAYPITETLFTIYRRLVYKKIHPLIGDRLHLHSLIYRRLLHTSVPKNERDLIFANARTAPFLWIFNALTLVPAVLWWDQTPILVVFFTLYVTSYVWLYRRLITFRTPRWMSLR